MAGPIDIFLQHIDLYFQDQYGVYNTNATEGNKSAAAMREDGSLWIICGVSSPPSRRCVQRFSWRIPAPLSADSEYCVPGIGIARFRPPYTGGCQLEGHFT